MRLSEAMLLGSTLSKQGFCLLASKDGSYRCALGAAMQAVGDLPYSFAWPWLSRGYAMCPVCHTRNLPVLTVVHLNDIHKWTREHIAEWVATVEPAEADSPADSRMQTEVFGQGPIPAEVSSGK